MKIPFVSKRVNKKYVPAWMYIVGAFLHILDGVLYLILVPFGYLSDFTTAWNGYILCHMIEKYPE